MQMLALFQYAFIQHAFLAGSLVAVVAAMMGYFLLLRGLTFAGHALSHIGFAGAAGAVLLGIAPVFGLLVFTIGASMVIGVLGQDIRERDTAIGVVMTFTLGVGLLFLALYSGFAERAYSILFGTILGISQTDVLVTAIFSVLVVGALLTLFRPLLFSSVDPEVAQARGVPVRWLGVVFLVLVAITVSMSAQVVGVLLVFTLLVGPAATANRLLPHPGGAIGLAVILGVAYTWTGIFVAALSHMPVSFCLAAISFGVYLPVRVLAPVGGGRRVARQERHA
jgi:zinc/manganese transport system permease protein